MEGYLLEVSNQQNIELAGNLKKYSSKNKNVSEKMMKLLDMNELI